MGEPIGDTGDRDDRSDPAASSLGEGRVELAKARVVPRRRRVAVRSGQMQASDREPGLRHRADRSHHGPRIALVSLSESRSYRGD